VQEFTVGNADPKDFPMVLRHVISWLGWGITKNDLLPEEIDPGELAEFEKHLERIKSITDVVAIFGKADELPDQVPLFREEQLRNIHRYWRHWKTLAADFGERPDDGKVAVMYYSKPAFLKARKE
jgi:hypothetical protein